MYWHRQALAPIEVVVYLNYMLQLSGSLLNQPVMSLRTGGQIASVLSAIINPNNLKLEGFYCQDSLDKKLTLVLLYQDIRDIIPKGIVVNDHEVLANPADLVRLKKIMDIGFELIGKQVYTVSKEKLGKVNDYAIDTTSMYIQKLYVGQSMLKSLTGGSLSVDRSQIIEITNRKIIIQEVLKGTPENAPAPALA